MDPGLPEAGVEAATAADDVAVTDVAPDEVVAEPAGDPVVAAPPPKSLGNGVLLRTESSPPLAATRMVLTLSHRSLLPSGTQPGPAWSDPLELQTKKGPAPRTTMPSLDSVPVMSSSSRDSTTALTEVWA